MLGVTLGVGVWDGVSDTEPEALALPLDVALGELDWVGVAEAVRVPDALMEGLLDEDGDADTEDVAV